MVETIQGMLHDQGVEVMGRTLAQDQARFLDLLLALTSYCGTSIVALQAMAPPSRPPWRTSKTPCGTQMTKRNPPPRPKPSTSTRAGPGCGYEANVLRRSCPRADGWAVRSSHG
jgi:hypothetical protein